ncbi:hypothetical protein ACRRTK_021776 [Alexandromys fortis]
MSCDLQRELDYVPEQRCRERSLLAHLSCILSSTHKLILQLKTPVTVFSSHVYWKCSDAVEKHKAVRSAFLYLPLRL